MDITKTIGDKFDEASAKVKDIVDDAREELDEAKDKVEAKRIIEQHADREPTPSEEAAAERADAVPGRVRDSYQDAMKKGANTKGEGAVTI